jgi:hypothetical protein
MARRISVLVKAVLASIAVLLAALALSIAPGQAAGLQSQAGHAAVVVQAPRWHADDHGPPCHGASSDPRCCTLTHACAAALAEPQDGAGLRLLIAERAEYSACATPAVNGVPIAPMVPPPRVQA